MYTSGKVAGPRDRNCIPSRLRNVLPAAWIVINNFLADGVRPHANTILIYHTSFYLRTLERRLIGVHLALESVAAPRADGSALYTKAPSARVYSLGSSSCLGMKHLPYCRINKPFRSFSFNFYLKLLKRSTCNPYGRRRADCCGQNGLQRTLLKVWRLDTLYESFPPIHAL